VVVDAVRVLVAEPVVDDGGLAAAPDRWQQGPDHASHGARDRGEVGAVAGGHGDPAWIGFVGAEGAGVDLENWPRMDTDGHESSSDEAFDLGSWLAEIDEEADFDASGAQIVEELRFMLRGERAAGLEL